MSEPKKYRTFRPHKTVRRSIHVPKEYLKQCLEAAREAAYAKFEELKNNPK